MAKGLNGHALRLNNSGLGNTRALRSQSPGQYPRLGSGYGQLGSTAVPTLLESYNRNSDFKRWKLGQEYYFGIGKTWTDFEYRSLARYIYRAAEDALLPDGSRDIVTMFPKVGGGGEQNWYTSCRTRGSLIFPVPILSEHIRLNTQVIDPTTHTLFYNCGDFYSEAQMRGFYPFIGDQFEDSAAGPNYPNDLLPTPVGSVALTLINVLPATRTLVFDLSKRYGRQRYQGRISWTRLPYDVLNPEAWDTGGGKYLCSSFKFFCTCPDHMHATYVNVQIPGETTRSADNFPIPNASRPLGSAWEQQGAAYYRQWKTLPLRRDERRDCKHIHAVRWSCGVPWLEPDDYPTANEREWLSALSADQRQIFSDEMPAYVLKQRLTYDNYVVAVADTAGVVVIPPGDVRQGNRVDGRPMLWTDDQAPDPANCLENDWWVQRGTQELRVFNKVRGQFQSSVYINGIQRVPMLEFVDTANPLCPVIVK
jgi:hypothetical protein